MCSLTALTQAELRMTLEQDKELALGELQELLAVKRIKEVEETKKKQWVRTHRYNIIYIYYN